MAFKAYFSGCSERHMNPIKIWKKTFRHTILIAKLPVFCQVELEYHNALKEKVKCRETRVVEFKVCVLGVDEDCWKYVAYLMENWEIKFISFS